MAGGGHQVLLLPTAVIPCLHPNLALICCRINAKPPLPMPTLTFVSKNARNINGGILRDYTSPKHI